MRRGMDRQVGCAQAREGFGGARLMLVLLFGMAAFAGMAHAQRASLTFAGTTKVGTSSQPVSVTLVAEQAGSAAAPAALTSGVANLDFAVSDPGTCGDNPTLSPGQSCTAAVIFTPRYPGVRQGALVIRSADGTQTLASAPLSGIGRGGLPVLVPGEINTVAGNGQWVFHGDGVAATSAPIFLPTGLAVDGAGNLFFSDSSNNRVRRVDAATGLISTVAGDGTAGSSGDGGAAMSAEVNSPSGVVLDGAGNLYIADSGNNVVRRVDAVTGVITTVAGRIGGSGYVGDGGPATNATLTSPQGLALTPGGDLVIADSGNATVRLLTFSDGKIQTVGGTGVAGYNADGISATTAQLNEPWGVAVRSDGAIAIADFSNERVRLVDTNGFISTIAGTGQRSFSGDGEAATQAALSEPAAVAFDPAGDLIIADSGNNRVRGVYGSPGIMTTLVGNSSEEFSGDAGPASSATLYGPYEVIFDAAGNIWIADMFHNRVREISGSMLGIAYPTMKVGKVSSPSPEMLYNAGNDPLTLSAPVLNQGALDGNSTTCGQSSLAPMIFCSMGVEFAPTQVGQNIAGSISWPSDAPGVTPVDDLNGQVLSVEPTSVALVAGANPGLTGQPLTLTATVSSANTSLSGTVTFSEGGSVLCNGIALSPGGTASCQISSLALGSHTFTAQYGGDNNDAASTSPAYIEIIKQEPALALAVSSSPTVVMSNVTLTLNAVDQTGTPTGSIVFLDGTTALATVPLNSSGVATWSTQTLAVGTHNISAQYAGDSANVAGTSNTASEEISQASTLTELASTNADVSVGTPVTLTATVVSSRGSAPTGSVQFTDGPGSGAALLGSAPLDSSGYASLVVSSLSPGSHSLVATYSGDTDDAASSSQALAQVIEQIATVTTLGADANPLNAGATLHLTAIVSLSSGATADGSLSGNVTFSDGGTVLGEAPINSTGQATLAVNTLGVGPHTIIARFGGSTNYATSNSVALNEVVQQTSTQVSLSSTSATTLVGKPATFAASVTSMTGTPTGTVSFRDGASVVGTAPLDRNGSASFSTMTLGQGTHIITAVYGGDSNYLAGTSQSLQQTVQLAQPSLLLSSPRSPVDVGTTVQMTATLSSPGTSPTGTLILSDGVTTFGSAPVSSTGSFAFTTNQLAIGTHTLFVSYSGDAGNAAVRSASITIMVQQAPSVTTLLASANPLTQGGALTLTATATSDSPNVAGAVNFSDGATLLGTSSLNTNGTASLVVSSLALGPHSLTAVYTGDTNHAGSTSATVQELVVQSSSATLRSSSNPAPSGQSVNFAAQITATGTVVPSGTATFRDNGTVLATVPLDITGSANFATTALSVGVHTISVEYSGDRNFAVATAQLIETVVNASTQVALNASANPATFGQPLSLTASVSSNGGGATGVINFMDGGTSMGSIQLGVDGVAVLTLSTLPPGLHTVTVSYAGDGRASPSVSSPLALVVKEATTLAVSSDANPALTLSPITFTAAIANSGATGATGTVSFSDGATLLGAAQLEGAGHATLTVPELSAGSHTIIASYAGDGANFASNSSTYTEKIQLRPTTISVTGSSTDPSNPQQVTLIAVVKGQGTAPPSGTVNFTNGNVTLGAGSVDATGVATITVIFEQLSEPITVSYGGDASYAGSQSSPSTIAAGEAPQFTLAVNVPSVALVTKQHATINVSIGSVKGFSDTIALGCLGLPYAATCTFDKSQLKLAPDGSATAALIVDTGDPLGAGSGASALLKEHDGGAFLCCFPAGLLLLVLRRRKHRTLQRRLSTSLLLAMAIVLSVGAVGCSGLSTGATAPGTYSFKVVGTAQGSGTTQAQTVTLVVTQ